VTKVTLTETERNEIDKIVATARPLLGAKSSEWDLGDLWLEAAPMLGVGQRNRTGLKLHVLAEVLDVEVSRIMRERKTAFEFPKTRREALAGPHFNWFATLALHLDKFPGLPEELHKATKWKLRDVYEAIAEPAPKPKSRTAPPRHSALLTFEFIDYEINQLVGREIAYVSVEQNDSLANAMHRWIATGYEVLEKIRSIGEKSG
jgi:hypothetical protein